MSGEVDLSTRADIAGQTVADLRFALACGCLRLLPCTLSADKRVVRKGDCEAVHR